MAVSALITLFMVFSASEGGWISSNNNWYYGTKKTKDCPSGNKVTELAWKEQGGYGLVDLWMKCSNGNTYKFTNNNNGRWNPNQKCYNGFQQLKAREQDNYGIINVRAWCKGSSGYQSSNNNYAGKWNKDLNCYSRKITGMAVIEQDGYGIINISENCT